MSVSLARQGGAQNTIGAGTDTLTNFENLNGSAHNDTLAGDGNANILNGLAGNDVITGNGGSDTLYGNSGADSFVFNAGFGRDTVADFVATGTGHDMIDFSTSVFANFAAVQSHMAQVGADVVITLDGPTPLP